MNDEPEKEEADLALALLTLREATLRHEDALAESARANTAECARLNEVNAAQKTVDRLIAEIKGSANRSTNWGQARLL